MKKIVLISIPILIALVVGLFMILSKDNYLGDYQIKVEVIDEQTPDRKLIVLRNGTETKKYKHIKYNDGKNTILCYQENPTANKHEIEDELIVVLPNDKEVIAKVIKEDK